MSEQADTPDPRPGDVIIVSNVAGARRCVVVVATSGAAAIRAATEPTDAPVTAAFM
jgi:hypothetical protein